MKRLHGCIFTLLILVFYSVLLKQIFTSNYLYAQNFTPIKRVVLCPWNKLDEENIANMTISKSVEFALNHLGIYVEYFDLSSEKLPVPNTKEFKEKYIGLLTYFTNENIEGSEKWIDWLEQYSKTELPWVALGKLGFLESGNPKIQALFAKFNVNLFDSNFSTPNAKAIIKSNWLEYERKLPNYYESIPNIIPQSKNFEIGLKFKLGYKHESAPVFVSQKMSLAYSNYGLLMDANAIRKQWVVNPFIFFQKAFGIKKLMPMPDVNILNGNRVGFIHIDGDGFHSKSQIEINTSADVQVEKYCGEILETNIFKKYSELPFGVSVIVAEVKQDEEGNERINESAKRILSLPNVELGTHTYYHPLHWGELEKFELSYNNKIILRKVNLDLEKEIKGSVLYLNNLIPEKKIKTVHWSGDCVVGEKAVAMSEEMGIQNINGGDSIFDEKHPSISYLSPLGRPWGNYFQVYSGNANENIYTSGWKENFYSYRDVIDTFTKTEKPILKPVNPYFHFYIGERDVSLRALVEVLEWFKNAKLARVFPSVYTKSVQAWRKVRIRENGLNHFTIENATNLNTIKIPEGKSLKPILQKSNSIIGYKVIDSDLYLFLDPQVKDNAVSIQLTDQNEVAEIPYLISMGGRISRFEKNKSDLKIEIEPFANGPLVLGGMKGSKVKVLFEGKTVELKTKSGVVEIPVEPSMQLRMLEVRQ